MRIDIPANKKFVHQMTIPVRWGDMDAMGHVNNGNYFRYMEMARIEWFRSLGLASDLQGQGMVIANAFCNFYRQLAYPDQVLLKMYVSDPGRTTFDTWVTMARTQAPEIICAAGGATVIWVDFSRQKAVTLPNWVRERIGLLDDSP